MCIAFPRKAFWYYIIRQIKKYDTYTSALVHFELKMKPLKCHSINVCSIVFKLTVIFINNQKIDQQLLECQSVWKSFFRWCAFIHHIPLSLKVHQTVTGSQGKDILRRLSAWLIALMLCVNTMSSNLGGQPSIYAEVRQFSLFCMTRIAVMWNNNEYHIACQLTFQLSCMCLSS